MLQTHGLVNVDLVELLDQPVLEVPAVMEEL